MSQKLDTVFEKLKCAPNLKVAFGFVLKNVPDEVFWFQRAQENDTLSGLSKPMATTEDLVRKKNVLSNTNVIEACAS